MRPLTRCWMNSAITGVRDGTGGGARGRAPPEGAPAASGSGGGSRLLDGGQLPELATGGDGDDAVLAVLHLGHDDVAVALPVLVELVEAVQSAHLECLEGGLDLGGRRVLGRLDGLGDDVDGVEAAHTLDH